MRQSLKLPTIFGIVVLMLGVVTGVMLVNSRTNFRSSANIEATPQNVRVSNITDTSMSVTWTTEIKSKGFVKWGVSKSSINKVALEEYDTESYVHSATIIGVKAGDTVYFNVNSNSKDYSNSNIPWEASALTTKVSASSSYITSGQVIESDGATPAQAIIYITLNGSILSTITSTQGNYVIPVSTYVPNIDENAVIEITAQAGPNGSAQAVIYPKYARNVPLITLGKSHDFRTLTGDPNSAQPESNVTIPESVDKNTRFDNTQASTKNQTTSSTFSIESINEGEIINTSDPEFFGSGPNGSNFEILVESELQTESISVDKNGKWSWSPPNNLELGDHKVTLKWKDQSGITRTLTRSFIVSAAEGPAFESTPSATPKQTSIATIKATSVATASATTASTKNASPTTKATAIPVPETGSLTPTIGLFIMGIMMLFGSIVVLKK